MNLFDVHVSEEAREWVQATLQAGWISEGGMVQEFELALEEELGVHHPVAVNSGTSALHLGLVMCDVGPGDEVILPAQTFIATGLAVLMSGALPVFADIKGKDLKSKSEEKYKLKNKKTITTE